VVGAKIPCACALLSSDCLKKNTAPTEIHLTVLHKGALAECLLLGGYLSYCPQMLCKQYAGSEGLKKTKK
jgi:hypothetical protein